MVEHITKLKNVYFRTAQFAKINLETVYVFLVSGDEEIDRKTIEIVPEFCIEKNYKQAILMGSMPSYESEYDYIRVDKEYIHYLLILQRTFHPFRNILMNKSEGYDDWDFYSFAGENGLNLEYLIRAVVFDMFSPNKNKMIPTLPPNKQPEVEWENIRDRIKKATLDYEELRNRYKGQYLLIHPYASGDMYMSCLYLEDYIKRCSIDQYKILCANKSSQSVGKLFGFNPIEEDREMLLNAILYARMYGFDDLRIKNTHAYPVNSRGHHVWHQIDFNTYVQRWVFQSKTKKVVPKLVQKGSLRLFEEKNLIPKRTILISPFSYTMEPMKDIVFEEIVAELSNRGYMVCTNIWGDEKPLLGTIGIQIPYDYVIDFVDNCAGFVGMRSGLCDIVSSTSTKMVVYHKEFCFNQFSLERMGLKTNNILEICIDVLPKEVIVEKTLKAFK